MAKNTPMPVRLHIRKQALKFSAAHMTVFPDGSKERLHGHNYFTELTVGVSETSLKKMVSFSLFKQALAKVCAQWDEKVLLATDCPHLKLSAGKGKETEFTLCGKRYVLPTEEVEKIGVDNITSENLAAEALRHILPALQKAPEFKSVEFLELRVDESPGQGASCRWERA
jgi:6-pyruvoyltetrahydropterin/6-carboxytetrahydropterin synthase